MEVGIAQVCLLRSQIEHEHFGLMAMGEEDLRFLLQQGGISRLQRLAIDLDLPAGHEHTGLATLRERNLCLGIGIQKARIQAGICVQGEHSSRGLRGGGSQQTQVAGISGNACFLLGVAGRG